MSDIRATVTADVTPFVAALQNATSAVQRLSEMVRQGGAPIGSLSKDLRDVVTSVNPTIAALAQLEQQLNAVRAASARLGEGQSTVLLQMIGSQANTAATNFQKMTQEVEVASQAAGKFNFATAGVVRELIVFGHEATQGNWSRFAGSVFVMAERVGGLQYVFEKMTVTGAAIGTSFVVAAAALGYFAYQAYEGARAVDDLSNRALILGQGFDSTRAQMSAWAKDFQDRFNESGVQIRALTTYIDKLGPAFTDQIPKIANLVEAFSSLKNLSLVEGTKAWEKQFGDTVESMLRGAEKIGAIQIGTGSDQSQFIQNLIDEGRLQDALITLAEKLNDRLKEGNVISEDRAKLWRQMTQDLTGATPAFVYEPDPIGRLRADPNLSSRAPDQLQTAAGTAIDKNTSELKTRQTVQDSLNTLAQEEVRVRNLLSDPEMQSLTTEKQRYDLEVELNNVLEAQANIIARLPILSEAAKKELQDLKAQQEQRITIAKGSDDAIVAARQEYVNKIRELEIKSGADPNTRTREQIEAETQYVRAVEEQQAHLLADRIAKIRADVSAFEEGSKEKLAAEQKILDLQRQSQTYSLPEGPLAGQQIQVVDTKQLEDQTKRIEEARRAANRREYEDFKSAKMEEIQAAKGSSDQIIQIYGEIAAAARRLLGSGATREIESVGRAQIRSAQEAQAAAFQQSEEMISIYSRVAQAKMAIVKSQLDQEVATHKITKDQEITAEANLTEEIYQQQRARLQTELDNDAQTVDQKLKVLQQIADLDTKAVEDEEKRQKELTSAIESENAKRLQDFKTLFDSIGSASEKYIEGMLTGQKNAYLDFMKSIEGALFKAAGSELSQLAGKGLAHLAGINVPEGSSTNLPDILAQMFGKWLGITKDAPKTDADRITGKIADTNSILDKILAEIQRNKTALGTAQGVTPTSQKAISDINSSTPGNIPPATSTTGNTGVPVVEQNPSSATGGPSSSAAGDIDPTAALGNATSLIPAASAMAMLRANQGPGAYGVPGAVMNYGSTGALGAPGSNLVTISTPSGHQFQVNQASAPSFQSFVNELEGSGYKINSIGGFSNRDKRGGEGLSEHAYGNAIDINPDQNPFQSSQTNLPPNIHDMAAKYGLIWGGDWQSPKDTMHFQWGGPGAGKIPDQIEQTAGKNPLQWLLGINSAGAGELNQPQPLPQMPHIEVPSTQDLEAAQSTAMSDLTSKIGRVATQEVGNLTAPLVDLVQTFGDTAAGGPKAYNPLDYRRAGQLGTETLSLAGLGGVVGEAPAGALGMFAGRRARMAPAESDMPYKPGSLFKDDLPRWEFSDKGASLNMDALNQLAAEGGPPSAPMSQIYSHPELYRNYPQLANRPISAEETGGPYAGSYNVETGGVSLNLNQSLEKLNSTMAHEVQHMVQGIEGFGRGSSPEEMLDRMGVYDTKDISGGPTKQELAAADRLYWQTSGEVEARTTQNRLGLSDTQRQLFPPTYGPGRSWGVPYSIEDQIYMGRGTLPGTDALKMGGVWQELGFPGVDDSKQQNQLKPIVPGQPTSSAIPVTLVGQSLSQPAGAPSSSPNLMAGGALNFTSQINEEGLRVSSSLQQMAQQVTTTSSAVGNSAQRFNDLNNNLGTQTQGIQSASTAVTQFAQDTQQADTQIKTAADQVQQTSSSSPSSATSTAGSLFKPGSGSLSSDSSSSLGGISDLLGFAGSAAGIGGSIAALSQSGMSPAGRLGAEASLGGSVISMLSKLVGKGGLFGGLFGGSDPSKSGDLAAGQAGGSLAGQAIGGIPTAFTGGLFPTVANLFGAGTTGQTSSGSPLSSIFSIFSTIFSALFSLEGGGVIPSAAGGIQVPDGKGGVLMIGHPEEVMLPAPLAKGFQGIIKNGAGLNIPTPNSVGSLSTGLSDTLSRSGVGPPEPAGPASSSTINEGDTHFHVQAIDGASVARFFDKHRDSIARSVSKARRNFNPSLSEFG